MAAILRCVYDLTDETYPIEVKSQHKLLSQNIGHILTKQVSLHPNTSCEDEKKKEEEDEEEAPQRTTFSSLTDITLCEDEEESDGYPETSDTNQTKRVDMHEPIKSYSIDNRLTDIPMNEKNQAAQCCIVM